MKVSIVVCTYNRADLLEEALQSLVDQTENQTLYEVVVVDNNSTDTTQKVAGRFAEKYNNFRVVTETQQGLSYARNRGYREAVFDWVAYMDDDAKAFPNYVERMLYVIENYDFDCFGGVYLPWFKNKKPKWYREEYQTNRNRKHEIGELAQNKYFSGGNCVFRQDLLVKNGGFSTEIGMKGNILAYGEETLMIKKLRESKCKIGFDPELKIEHYVDVSKQKLLWFFKSSYAHGRDSWKSFKIKITLFQVLKALGNMALLPIMNFPRSFLRVFTSEYYFQNFIIDTFRSSAVACGQFAEGMRRLLKR